MKKVFLAASIITATLLSAQNKHINFETGNLASVFAKAKKENKLIFVDAFTTWCGPCKFMAKTVFTNDTVADYYNSTFVNLKLDMEKGEGIEFAKKYNVSCYPNLLYIDGNGNLVNRTAGALPAAAFIETGKNSLIPERTFVSKKSNFDKNGVNESNILEYVELMSGSCLDPSEKVAEYLKSVKDEDLQNNTNWTLMKDHIYDHQSREMKYFISNISAFETKYGKPAVDQKVAQLGFSYFSNHIRAKKYDAAAYEVSKKEFTSLNWPNTPRILFDADMNVYGNHDKTKYFALAASDFQKYNNDDPNALNSVAWEFYENVSDKTQLKAAANMAKRACELQNSYANLDTYAAVLYKGGEYQEAETIANKAIDKAKADNLGPDDYKETSELLKKIKLKK